MVKVKTKRAQNEEEKKKLAKEWEKQSVSCDEENK